MPPTSACHSTSAAAHPARVSAVARHSSTRNPAAGAPYAVGLGVRPDPAPRAGLHRSGVPFHKALWGRARHSPPETPAAGAPFRSRTALDRGCCTRKRRFRSMNPRPARRFPIQYGRNRAKPPRSERLALPKHGSAPFCVPFLNFNRACHSTTRLPADRVVALPRRKRLDPLVGRYRKDGGVAPRSPPTAVTRWTARPLRTEIPPSGIALPSLEWRGMLDRASDAGGVFAAALRAGRSRYALRPARNPLPIFWPKDSHPCARGN